LDPIHQSDYYTKKPFILTDVTSSTQPHFTKEELRDVHGSKTVLVGIARDIIRNHGSGYSSKTLSEFINKMKTSKDERSMIGGDAEYAFDRGEFFNQAPQLKEKIDLGSTPFTVDSKQVLYLALGDAYSGTQFHHHADGWNLQIYGKKRWLLYAPGELPALHYPPLNIGVRWWIEQFLPKLTAEEQPTSCVVAPNELIYIPDGWYHATINLGESVGVAGQQNPSVTELQQLFDKVW
jgi:hypothetical protein